MAFIYSLLADRDTLAHILEEVKKQGEEVKKKLEDTKQEIKTLRDSLAKAEIRRLQKKIDCWHSNNGTETENRQFKDSLANYYQCSVPSGSDLKCMVTNRYYPRNEVCACHLVKRATQGDTMHLYGLPPDINNPRNGILMLEPIEQAFDQKEICFLYDSLTNELKVKVLNPLLVTEPLTALNPRKTYPMTYGDIDGLTLQLPTGIFPYRRVLSMHAKFAYSQALNMGWIADSETLNTYFNISDAGLEEPAGLGELSWHDVHFTIHHTPI